MSVKEDVYTKLATLHGFGPSKRYRRILEMLMSPLQATLVALLPASHAKLAGETGLEKDAVKLHLDDLFRKGVILPRYSSGREEFCFCASVEQLHDSTLTSRTMDPARASAFFDQWNEFCHREWYPQYARQFAALEQPRERIIPAYRAVEDVHGLLPHEDIREIFKCNPLIAAVPCPCRRRERKCDKPVNVCIQFGPSAEYAVHRGTGRMLSYDEAVELADQCEDAGLVHGWINTDTMNSHCMCNCCNDCCIAMVPLMEHQIPLEKRVAKSRFDARVDPELCEGCRVCIDRCPFDAIEMVQTPGSEHPLAAVIPEKCFGCGVCVLKCESKALSLVAARPPEHIPRNASA